MYYSSLEERAEGPVNDLGEARPHAVYGWPLPLLSAGTDVVVVVPLKPAVDCYDQLPSCSASAVSVSACAAARFDRLAPFLPGPHYFSASVDREVWSKTGIGVGIT